MFSWSRTVLMSNVTEIAVIHVEELIGRNHKRIKCIFVYQKQAKHKTAASRITTKLYLFNFYCFNNLLLKGHFVSREVF